MSSRDLRKLTRDEIEYILSEFDKANPMRELPQYIVPHYFIRENLREQLERASEIDPRAVEELKDEIIDAYYRALITPGEAVGIWAAVTLIGPVTQATLNTFHQSGQLKTGAVTGASRVRELISGTETKKKTSQVFFRDPITFDEVASLRSEIPEILMDSLTSRIMILKPRSTITDEWLAEWENTVGNLPSELVEEEEPSWYPAWKAIFGEPHDGSPNTWFARIVLDRAALYANKVRMEEISNRLKEYGTCVTSPTFIGIVDFYPHHAIYTDVAKYDTAVAFFSSLFYLNSVFIPKYRDMKLRGVDGIVKLIPHSLPTLHIADFEDRDEQGRWVITLNEFKMTTSGINEVHLARLLRACGVEVLSYNRNLVLCAASTVKPLTVVRAAIEKDKKDEDAYEERAKSQGKRAFRRPPTDITNLSSVYTAMTEGSNMAQLALLPYVDTTRTVGNNPHEVARLLGINAAKNVYIREFHLAIGTDASYVDPRHINFLADFAMVGGRVSGVTFNSISRTPRGPIDKATIQQATTVFVDAGIYGQEQKINSATSNIFVGTRANVGTEFGFSVALDRDKLKAQLKALGRKIEGTSENAIERITDTLVNVIESDRKIITWKPDFLSLDQFLNVLEGVRVTE